MTSMLVETDLIQALEDACNSTGQTKANHLSTAKEILVYKLPEKMADYFPLLLEFQTSAEAVVKQRVVEAIMECVEAAPQLSFLTAAAGCIRSLLNDAFPSVAKASIVGTKNLVTLALHSLCYAQQHEKSAAEGLWRAVTSVLDTVLSPRLTRNRNQGVQMLTFKLLEQVTLMTSASHCPGVKGRFKTKPFAHSTFPGLEELRRISQECRRQLTAHARPSLLKTMPVCVQIVVLQTHASLCVKRPALAQEMVSALLQSADSVKAIDAADPEAVARKSKPSVASLRKACLDALLFVLKAEDPVLIKQEQRIVRGLAAMRAQQQALEAIKRRNTAIQKAERATEREQERAAAEEEPPQSRARTAAPAIARPTTPQPKGFLPRPQYAESVGQVAAHVPKLLCQTGLQGVMNFIDQLEPSILIELVITRMEHLPDSSPGDDATIDSLLSQQRATCSERLEALARKAPPQITTAQAPTAAAPSSASPSAPSPPVRPSLPPPVLKPISAPEPEPPQPPAPVLPPAPPKIAVRPPSRADCALIQGAIIRRILHAPKTLTPLHRLRMVAKLAPAANSPEGQQLLLGFKDLLDTDMEAAVELVVAWLYTLFVKQCHALPEPNPQASPSQRPPPPTATEAESIEAAATYLSGLESVIETLCNCTNPDARMSGGRFGSSRSSGLPPVTVLITEVPLLPEAIAKQRLSALCKWNSQWGKVALLTMRELIKSKHSLKPVMLKLAIDQLLQMRDPELKSGTMRMLANQVYPVLLREEATRLEDAAVRLISDFPDDKPVPAPPTDEADDAMQHARFLRHVARAAAHACELFTVLCTKRPSLLKRYCGVFLEEGQDEDIKVAILDSIESIGKVLSPDSRSVLSFIEDSPASAAPLMLRFLEGVLSKTGGIPPPPLVDAAMKHYDRSNDVHLLALVIPGMPSDIAKACSGQLVKLPLEEFKVAVRRIVSREDDSPSTLPPRDFLLHLHEVDHALLRVKLAEIGAAVTACIKMKTIFTQEIATGVLSQLVHREPLPPLIMRTLINVWHAHLDAQRYLVNTIADQLLRRRIYDHTESSLWTGFVLFASFAMDAASIGPVCELLLRLPPEKLELLLKAKSLVDNVAKEKMSDYVSRLNDRIIDGQILRVLGIGA